MTPVADLDRRAPILVIGVIDQMPQAHRVAKRHPLLAVLIAKVERDLAVAGFPAGVSRPARPEQMKAFPFVGVGVGREQNRFHRHQRAQTRHLHVLPLAAAQAREQGRRRRMEGMGAARHRANFKPEAARHAIGLADVTGEAGQRLHRQFGTGKGRERAALSLRIDFADDQAGLLFGQCAPVNPAGGAIHRVQLHQHHVGRGHGGEQTRAPGPAGKVALHALFAAIELLKDRRTWRAVRADALRPPLAAAVAAGRLELDHLGAEIGQHQPAHRAGDPFGHFDDAQFFEALQHSGTLLFLIRGSPICCSPNGTAATLNPRQSFRA